VQIPRGTYITGFRTSTYDNDATYNISVNLRWLDTIYGTTGSVASTSTTGASTNIQVKYSDLPDTRVFAPNTYYITTCLNSGNIRLYSASIYYQYETMLPNIQR
jgi:hypothetical protein